jgi:hypothetical protein
MTTLSTASICMGILLGAVLAACVRPDGGIQSDNTRIGSREYQMMPHYRAWANPWCSSDAIVGYAAWNAPTAEAAAEKAVEVCSVQTNLRTTCRVCWISDTHLIGLTQEEIGHAITVYNSNNSATSFDMIGRANPVKPPMTLEELRKSIRESYELNNERGLLR